MLEIKEKYEDGTTISAVVGETTIGSIQSLQCSITREVFLDEESGKYSKGRKQIAGTLVFSKLDPGFLNSRESIPEFSVQAFVPETDGKLRTYLIEGVVLVNEGYGWDRESLSCGIPITYVARSYQSPMKSV